MARTFFIIDGYAQIFRAYFAIKNGMRNPATGEVTHAVFGFTAMLLKLLSQHHPDFVAVALDHPDPHFRDALYGDYKATRRETPDDLTSQVPRIVAVIRGFGIPVVSPPGLEADDAIATMVQRVLDDPDLADVRIRMVSKDKDLEQLICDRVTLYDIHTEAELDAAGLWESKGITPEQVIDFLTLCGDTVDNVPGVDGIGPKTAAQLIARFGTIEGIYEHLETHPVSTEIKGKRRENLEKARGHLPLSRRLITLTRDADFLFDLEEARVGPPQPSRLLPLFQELGFIRFPDEVRRLALTLGDRDEGRGVEEAIDPATLETYLTTGARFTAVTSQVELDELVRTLAAAPIFSIDTETTGLEREADLCGLSFSWPNVGMANGVYVPVRSPNPEQHLDEATVLNALRPLLEDEARPKCGHNLKFDARVLLQHGVRLRGVVFDSMLAMALLDPQQPAGLDPLAAKLLGYRMIPLSALLGESRAERTIEEVPLEQVTPYAAEDAVVALRLWELLTPRLEECGVAPLMREVEGPLAPVLAEMEHHGILCDPLELRRQGEVLGARAKELRTEIQSAAGCEFSPDSPRQLAEVLFQKLGFKPVKKTRTGVSTDHEVLERLAALEVRPARKPVEQPDPSRQHNQPSNPRIAITSPELGAGGPSSVTPPELGAGGPPAPAAVPRLVLEYRQLTKLIGTYLGNLDAAIDPGTGRIHSTFHQLVTATGRLASTNPNLQNIPIRSEIGRQIRKAFPTTPGHCLICADYSQIELRLLAHLSGDEALTAAFARDEDIHAAVAAQVFGVALDEVTREQRAQAKTINFGIIYGISAFGLARRIEGLDRDAATRLIADYKERFPGIDRFLRQCVLQALDHGYVTTLLGRRRSIPEIHAPTRTQRNLGERLAINTVVQGSAADLIKVAMVNVQRRIDRDRLPLKLLVQIHDELVFEAPAEGAEEQAALVIREMERAMNLNVPLRAEAGIGPDWLSAK